MTTPRELKALYARGQNISALLREEQGLDHNTDEIIELSYDLQTGSYTAAMENEAVVERLRGYTEELARTILARCEPRTILEAGIGEGTTFSGVLRRLGAGLRGFGFDLSWSRVAYARRWLCRQGLDGATLCTGNLTQLPFADESIDVVYTSHSIEPNAGREEQILKELHRVARRLLVLLEPGYELASDEARRRMEHHGYCRGLKDKAEALGYRVLEHRLFPFAANPLNPTALTVIEKSPTSEPPAQVLACPRFKTPLVELGSALFSPEALVAYPILGGIPCLRLENGIRASKYDELLAS